MRMGLQKESDAACVHVKIKCGSHQIRPEVDQEVVVDQYARASSSVSASPSSRSLTDCASAEHKRNRSRRRSSQKCDLHTHSPGIDDLDRILYHKNPGFTSFISHTNPKSEKPRVILRPQAEGSYHRWRKGFLASLRMTDTGKSHAHKYSQAGPPGPRKAKMQIFAEGDFLHFSLVGACSPIPFSQTAFAAAHRNFRCLIIRGRMGR